MLADHMPTSKHFPGPKFLERWCCCSCLCASLPAMYFVNRQWPCKHTDEELWLHRLMSEVISCTLPVSLLSRHTWHCKRAFTDLTIQAGAAQAVLYLSFQGVCCTARFNHYESIELLHMEVL